jgi:thermostable 8-oxoguanine DNA glycosylase
MDFAKPDRHLVRIAKSYKLEVEEMCLNLSKQTGERIGVVDVVIWRAANLGFI